jgi:putative radical SAM enzyme (TIGR03279 family)
MANNLKIQKGQKGLRGIKILSVAKDSPSHAAGLRAGDRLLKIDGQRVLDLIDYLFNLEGPQAELEILRGDKSITVELELDEGEDAGLELEHFKVRTCKNKCKFCFVSQLPKGMRRPLYIKDEDYRMSFLYGNYVTLAGLAEADRKRIIRQHLSPLYVSVHSTNTELRNSLLGNPGAPDIIDELKFFIGHGIQFHAQIVLCPGFNDGKELKRTIRDIYSLYPAIMSLAVVPLGLTSFSKAGLNPVERLDANKAIEIVDSFADKYREKDGEAFVYSADELYLKARRAFPRLSHYGDLPQYENGVGMIPLFRAEVARIKKYPDTLGRRFLTFTGVSFYPSLKRFIDKLNAKGITINALPLENDLFGRSVTVTGLLSGQDVIKTLAPIAGEYDTLLLPDVVLREGDNVFLDDVSVSALGIELGIEVKVIESCPEGLMEGLL